MNLTTESENIPQQPKRDADLQVIANVCSASGCPTIYRTSTGDLLVQGYTVGDSGMDLPDGEGLVRIPADLLAEAFRSL